MKRVIFFISILFGINIVFAQNISDDKVYETIITEQKKGTSQQRIVSMLLREGVTAEQLQRVKSKVEQQHMSLSSKSQSTVDIDRTREDSEFLGADIEVDTKKDTLNVFGRNIFNNKQLTFEPSMNIPTPANYILGAGDDLIIDIWGASQLNIRQKISPDGDVFIDGVGPVVMSGMSIAQAENHLSQKLADVYGGSQVSLSLGEVRSIQVQVMGEVVVPGTYTISALATAFNALYSAGGINKIGTLRDIKVYRAGKLLASLDVYEYILNGKTNTDLRLKDNDVINVGAYKNIVELKGRVKRPMRYEMLDGETLFDAISYAGGFAGDAYTEQMNVVRKNGREFSMHTVTKSDAATFEVKDGDVVKVDAMIQRFSNMVEISGAVFYPGKFELGSKISTIAGLVKAAGGVREEAFLSRAVLQHRRFDNTIFTEAVDLNAILEGAAPDVELKNNDLLFIPSNTLMSGEIFFTIDGEVNLPGKYNFAENTTIEDLVLQAGGLTRQASYAKVDVFRIQSEEYGLEFNPEIAEVYSFTIKEGFVVDGANSFVLKPYDKVVVRKNPTYTPMKGVTVKGNVNFPGVYIMQNEQYRLSNLVKDAGGFTSLAYIKGASLYRKYTKEELQQREIVLKNSHIQLLEENIRSNGKDIDIALLDSLMTLKLGVNEYYSVAVDLAEAVENPGQLADIVLREDDILNIPQNSNTIRVSGEVHSPSTLTLENNKSVKYYIKHSGGYNSEAHKKGVYVIYMNGEVVKVSKSSKSAVQPGCEIVVPRKVYKNSRLSMPEIATIGSAATSVAAMIIAIINLVK